MKFNSLLSRILFSCVLVFSISTVFAQSTRKPAPPVVITKEQASELKKQAADLYKANSFKAAIDPYVKLVSFDPDNMDYNYKLGMCYLNSNVDKSQAIQHFVKAADKKDAPKDVYYQMGRSLLAANLFDEAIEAFEKYKEVNKGVVNAKMNLNQYIEYCYNGKEYVKKPLEVKFTNPGKLVNSISADYAPIGMAVDSALYFTSNRKGNMGGIVDGFGEIIPDIYSTSKTDTSWTKAKNPGTNLNSELYDISTGLNSNGDKMLVYKEGAEAAGDIYISSLKGKSWQKAELLDPSLATKTLETGACISNDGKRIFFAADMKGTLGGKDIFMMEMNESKKWGAPVNLGPTINTKLDEENPMLWHDGKTLFFSSQGHTSMGGFDVFMSYRPDPVSDWAKPMNIGFPLNTTGDDLYFTLAANARTGYVATVKKGGLGDLDIWYFNLTEPLIKNAGVLFRASILSPQGLPSKDAMCSVVKESTGEVLGIMEANGAAAEIFILLPAGNYKLKARSPKMGRLEEDIVVTGDEGEKGISKVFKMQPNPSSKP
ncbi:MAG: tetratricopeptide repeat protein [Bacteroidetes bacterium]|nr:tetratricopeptide repeat protein [Bacteroidota bacterium]